MKSISLRLFLLALPVLGACSPSVTTRSLPDSKSIPPVRVLIAKADQFVTVSANSIIRLKDENSKEIMAIQPNQKVQLRRANDTIEVSDAQGIFLTRVARLHMAAPGPENRFEVGAQSYRGDLVAFVADSTLQLVNSLDMESYLMGVVRNEIGRVGMDQMEAAKAQAVAARTYAVRNKGRYKAGYDFVSDQNDQVYQGASSESDVTTRAVIETAGEIAEFDGKPINALYFSTCGGVTSNPVDVWKSSTPVAYLTRVSDVIGDRCLCDRSPHYRWEVRWTGEEIDTLVKINLPKVLQSSLATEDFSKLGDQTLYNVSVLSRDSSQRITAVKFGFTKDSYTVTGEQARRIMRGPRNILYSSLFRVAIDREEDGRIKTLTCKGAGFGHGVGMCQYAALELAKQGYSYGQILQFFYRGITLRKTY